jgi:hypothetical protein
MQQKSAVELFFLQRNCHGFSQKGLPPKRQSVGYDGKKFLFPFLKSDWTLDSIVNFLL